MLFNTKDNSQFSLLSRVWFQPAGSSALPFYLPPLPLPPPGGRPCHAVLDFQRRPGTEHPEELVLCRAIGVALLQGTLGHIQAGAAELEPVVEACRRQPCLVHIAGRALAQGCLSLQALLNSGSGRVSISLTGTRKRLYGSLYYLGLVMHADSSQSPTSAFGVILTVQLV